MFRIFKVVFVIFELKKKVLEVREAFQWIQDAILLFPEVSRPQNHFSGPISDYFRKKIDVFRDFNFWKFNCFRKSRSHVAVQANPSRGK